MNLNRRDFIRLGSGGVLVGLTAGCDAGYQAWLPLVKEPQRVKGPFRSPVGTGIDEVRHVLNRLTFGARPGDYEAVQGVAEVEGGREWFQQYLEKQLNPGEIRDERGEYAVRRLETLSLPAGELFEYQEDLLFEELSRGAVLRAIYSERQLYEVMVEFWTDHFNIDPSKGDCKWLKVSDDRDVIRRHALGDFKEMLSASARSPAMLWYLDGRVNRKDGDEEKPNENYARELLELHSLGVDGGYSQEDVMEVARCLTGWTVRETGRAKFGLGKVEFHPHLHDNGEKRVLGKIIPPGLMEKDLDRVLEIVATHPSTATYLANKLCRRFIKEDPDPETVKLVADSFLKSNGNIAATLRSLFYSEAFWTHRGNLFKRPFHFIASALRGVWGKTHADEELMKYLGRMGHAPFSYPTPDGYPLEAQPWMGTLLWRWHFAVHFARNQVGRTVVEWENLKDEFGGESHFMAHLLGRLLTSSEEKKMVGTEGGIAMALASPGFQWF